MVFRDIDRLTGPLQVDLFALQLTYQLPNYMSWRPDPTAMATDAFTLDWTKFQGYANPPWNMVGRVLTQVRHQKARLVLMAPVWKSQAWYPLLLEMLTRKPLLLPNSPHLIQPTHRVNQPDTTPQLAAWVISGIYRFRSQELSEGASALLLASWRQKSAKTYDSLFNTRIRLCSERDTDPISGDRVTSIGPWTPTDQQSLLSKKKWTAAKLGNTP